MNKQEQRKTLRKIRDEIPQELRTLKSSDITEKFLKSDKYISAETVMLYISFGSEPDTFDILDRVISDGKKLAVPLCDSVKCEITAFGADSLSQLKSGSYEILEPDSELIESGVLKPVQSSEIDLVVVPGLGFDKYGYRIGYGKGYYDRFLNGFAGDTVGLCFKECLLDKIYRDEFDIKVDTVITDSDIMCG